MSDTVRHIDNDQYAKPAGGAIGGGTDLPEKKHAHARGAITFLMRQLKRAEDLADRDWGPIVEFAARVRDDETASTRDRIRATELLTSLIAKGVDVAVILDKNDRLDDGKSTENIVHKLYAKDVDTDAV